MSRKKFSWLAVLMVAIFALAACGNKKEEEKSSSDKVEMVDYKAKTRNVSLLQRIASRDTHCNSALNQWGFLLLH